MDSVLLKELNPMNLNMLYAKPELKVLREKKKWTQEEMVGLLKASGGAWQFERSYYTLIENSERPVDSEIALAIARVLKVKVEEVFQNKEGAN